MKSILDWSICDSREPAYVETATEYETHIILYCLSIPALGACWTEEIEFEQEGKKCFQRYIAVSPEFGGRIISRIWHGQIERFLKELCENSPIFAERRSSLEDASPYTLPKEYQNRLLGVVDRGSGVAYEGSFTEEQFVTAYLEAGFDPRDLTLLWEDWAHRKGLHPKYPAAHTGTLEGAPTAPPAPVAGRVLRNEGPTTADSATVADTKQDDGGQAEPQNTKSVKGKTSGKRPRGRERSDDVNRAKYPDITKRVGEWMRLGHSESKIIASCEEEFYWHDAFSGISCPDKKRDIVRSRMRWVINHPNWHDGKKGRGQKGGKK